MADSQYGSTTDQLLKLASDAITRANNQASRIQSQPKPGLKETSFNFQAPSLKLDAPPNFSDLLNSDNAAGANIDDLNGRVQDWLDKYFPNISTSLAAVPEDWLVGVIGGTKPYGQDSTAFDLVWQRMRDRAYRTASSQQRTLEASFSARGFSVPPGALVDAIMRAEQVATEAALDANREQAVKEAEIKVEILKFAVQISANMKIGVMQSAADYFKSYTALYNLDNEGARIKAQAYSSFYAALASYYNVEVSLEELKLKAAEGKASTDSAIDRNRLQAYSVLNGNDALGQATRAFGDIASGAASAAGSLVAQIESV